MAKEIADLGLELGPAARSSTAHRGGRRAPSGGRWRRLRRAFAFAEERHRTQLRFSGEPFITHPLGCALICAGLGLDGTAVTAALLHDTVEDTDATIEDIEREFGAEVAALVDGVTKLSKLHFDSQEEHQAENYRKLIVSMSSDIRVLIVKLADRLHNMRTLAYMTKPKQIQKAKETLEVYAPLAHRLGIHSLKWELEDLAFSDPAPEAVQRDPADGQPAPAGPRAVHPGGRAASSGASSRRSASPASRSPVAPSTSTRSTRR